jgi:hypothetical protein
MCCKGFTKRILPFFLTFSLGLLIASFFVSIAAPNFSFKKRGWSRHQQYDRQMELENQQLREEKNQLKNQLEDATQNEFRNLKYELRTIPAKPLSEKTK